MVLIYIPVKHDLLRIAHNDLLFICWLPALWLLVGNPLN